jgi:hypothetical protein
MSLKSPHTVAEPTFNNRADLINGITYPLATSHIRIVLSLLAETNFSPSGVNLTVDIEWSCPCNVFVFRYSLLGSHSFIVRSELHVTGSGVSAQSRQSVGILRHKTKHRGPIMKRLKRFLVVGLFPRLLPALSSCHFSLATQTSPRSNGLSPILHRDNTHPSILPFHQSQRP